MNASQSPERPQPRRIVDEGYVLASCEPLLHGILPSIEALVEVLLCRICFDTLRDPFRFGCGHSICSKCIAAASQPPFCCRCPRCGEELKLSDCHPDPLMARWVDAYRALIESLQNLPAAHNEPNRVEDRSSQTRIISIADASRQTNYSSPEEKHLEMEKSDGSTTAAATAEFSAPDSPLERHATTVSIFSPPEPAPSTSNLAESKENIASIEGGQILPPPKQTTSLACNVLSPRQTVTQGSDLKILISGSLGNLKKSTLTKFFATFPAIEIAGHEEDDNRLLRCSHLVCTDVDADGRLLTRSFKLYWALACRAKLVSFDWLVESLSAGRLIDEHKYHVRSIAAAGSVTSSTMLSWERARRRAPIFAGMQFYVERDAFRNTLIPEGYLRALLRRQQARVVATPRRFSPNSSDVAFVVFGCLDKRNGASMRPRLEAEAARKLIAFANVPGVRAVRANWVICSLLHGRLVNVNPHLI